MPKKRECFNSQCHSGCLVCTTHLQPDGTAMRYERRCPFCDVLPNADTCAYCCWHLERGRYSCEMNLQILLSYPLAHRTWWNTCSNVLECSRNTCTPLWSRALSMRAVSSVVGQHASCVLSDDNDLRSRMTSLERFDRILKQPVKILFWHLAILAVHTQLSEHD